MKLPASTRLVSAGIQPSGALRHHLHLQTAQREVVTVNVGDFKFPRSEGVMPFATDFLRCRKNTVRLPHNEIGVAQAFLLSRSHGPRHRIQSRRSAQVLHVVGKNRRTLRRSAARFSLVVRPAP